MRNLNVLMMDNTNELDKNISDGDDSNSDPDYSDIETESDDTSIDEFISKDDDPSDSDSTGVGIDISNQPESVKKNGVSWRT
ncbi:unnamed protein product [Rotaria magnacalcarata]|uniref:Uncharacterized protein n=1 Tax=Rotaria magnacalcarata TaxID=392030 RepID=A0A816NSY4_9BILA|nr:unnamed protein product [Rotaria magnacalcarata]